MLINNYHNLLKLVVLSIVMSLILTKNSIDMERLSYIYYYMEYNYLYFKKKMKKFI